MRLVAYEWCSSGGLAGPDAPRIGGMTVMCGESPRAGSHQAHDSVDDRHTENSLSTKSQTTERFLREGRAMLEAIAADAARHPSLDVTVLVDETMDRGEKIAALWKPTPPCNAAIPCNAANPRNAAHTHDATAPQVSAHASPHAHASPRATVRRVPVRRGHDIETLVAEAREADWTIIVAPETDGILASRVAAVRSTGGRVLAPHGAFLSIASDKQATIDCLAAAGVAVPAGRVLSPLEPVPPGFRMPAVRKDRGSAGGDGLVILHSANAAPSAAPSRLEAFVEGIPVGVAVLCGPAGFWPLPPMRQRFTGGDFPRYLGGEPLADGLRTNRASRLAERAIKATMRAAAIRDPAAGTPCGWVGVDMILGARDDGSDDRVLEINPRFTTSFVGLSAGQPESLVAGLIAIAEGRGPVGCGDWKPGIAFSID